MVLMFSKQFLEQQFPWALALPTFCLLVCVPQAGIVIYLQKPSPSFLGRLKVKPINILRPFPGFMSCKQQKTVTLDMKSCVSGSGIGIVSEVAPRYSSLVTPAPTDTPRLVTAPLDSDIRPRYGCPLLTSVTPYLSNLSHIYTEEVLPTLVTNPEYLS